ncbi:protein NRT1/ PTR FAMILY 8.3-like [Canna indica]|uniref:Protein NRT1/ PTR FAMILY 8.3-like n=1 Tax=Canna indica TaxID=4628 RepID=A0AAQ3KV74_9LILI|nr:protein NRT1/ PTR FAMILY 8.3-like [Canna indica]
MGSLEDEQRSPLEEGLLAENENEGPYTGDGSVDIHGNPVLKNGTGNWRACPFILGNECCERLAYYGISTNLVTYLKYKLHEGNASAARNVTTWAGTCYITPLIGAVLADAYWGRYWTIAVFSTIYFIGMSTLTLSASIPAFKPPACVGSICPEASVYQYAVFFVGLYLIALGTGGIKPCVSSFGADQFDDTDPRERVKKGSFFNWFYFSINIGALISSSFLVWVQDNWGWGLGFGIPTLFMGFAILSFFFGTPLYRFQKPGGSPILRMSQVIVASFHKWKVDVPLDSSLLYELPDKASAIKGSRKIEHTDELKFLDKAATVSDIDRKTESFSNPWRLCTVTQVEELKILVRMFPVWATTIVFSAVYAQISSMFVEQGMVMDTKIGSFTIPPASLSTFDVISVIVWVPIYDRILVPLARRFTGNEKGFSELQRMGIGLFISILAMAAAAVVEIRRLDIAKAEGIEHEKVAVPISIFWQTPQYFLVGAAEVFTFIGSLEFFYDQSPDAMRSLCTAFSLLTTALGNYLSSFIVTVVTSLTTRGGKPGWIPDNLNEGHLDYYFWVLAGLSFANLLVYVACAVRYKSKRAS